VRATSDDRRGALILLGLAAAGLAVRLALSGGAPPGAVGYRPAPEPRPPWDSVTAGAQRLARPLAPGEKIDLDRAGAVDLVRLPRIGPALAARIVADRADRGPFGSLEALDRVPGIGPVLLEAVRPHAAFSGRPTRRGESPQVPGIVTLNTATAGELAQLPAIGPARARAIVEDRRRRGPFRRLEDLMRVPGVGRGTVERLRGLVRVP
jgi:competence ComEA-like helix-hairpin-helix protein